ncbi:MAG: hypothetical protein ACPGVG_16420 [Mycobacterium sp.]
MPELTTRELLARLERHYIKPGAPLPGGIFLPEVGWNGRSGGGCDAIYVGFTSTSGRILVGHELKVSRADWLCELNKPGKSDAWADQCHEWWLVVSDPGIVQDGELPAGWGLMVPGTSKTRMRVIQKPDRRPRIHCPSWEAVRSIMARQDTLRAQAISDVRGRARNDLHAENQQRIEDEVARRMRAVPDARRLADQMLAITNALRAQVDFADDKEEPQRWRPSGVIGLGELRVIGQLIRESRDLNEAVSRLTDGFALGSIRRAVDQLEKALAGLRAIPGEQMELADA